LTLDKAPGAAWGVDAVEGQLSVVVEAANARDCLQVGELVGKLVDVEAPARAQHPSKFCQRALWVLNVLEHAAGEHGLELAVLKWQLDRVAPDVGENVRIAVKRHRARHYPFAIVECLGVNASSAQQVGDLAPATAPVKQRTSRLGRNPVSDLDVLEHLGARTNVDVQRAPVLHIGAILVVIVTALGGLARSKREANAEATLTAENRLSIGIDARAAAEVGAGRGRVVRELLTALAQRDDPYRYLLYARSMWGQTSLDQRFCWKLIDAPDPLWHLLAARAANRRCGVFLSSNSYLTAWFLRIPSVPIVHDMIPFDPAMHPNRRSAVIERLTLPLAVRRAAALLCTTQATRSELIERFPAARSTAQVVPLGASPIGDGRLSAEELAELPAPGFVLAVGTLEPRKNLPRLVAAYARLDPALQAAHPLVVVGALGWEAGETLRALRSLGDRCKMLGYVPDAALAELYTRCSLFCYPSLGEGFGLPVLEAMTQGAAVLTSNLSSLPEIGGEAVEYVDPRSVSDIADGMRRLLSEPARRQELRRRGLERASSYSWDTFADHVLDALAMAACAPA
jgi:glycosyltransferase involved in cell wall biosynthesis